MRGFGSGRSDRLAKGGFMSSMKVQSITYVPPAGQGGAAPATLGGTPQQSAMDFLQLISAEITNQSPDSPVDDTAMITQYSQMNSAIAFQQLAQESSVYDKTAEASPLLNQQVIVLDPDGKTVSQGTVTGIDFSGSDPLLTVNGRIFPLASVLKVGQ